MAKKPTKQVDIKMTGRDGTVYIFDAKQAKKSEVDYGELLREAIRDSGVSHYHLAKISGVSQQVISFFVSGGDMRVSKYSKLAGVMGFEIRQNKRKAAKSKPPKK